MSEETIVRNCSATLAGLKTGSLFRCTYRCAQELYREIRRLNRRLGSKGLRVLPLLLCGGEAQIYMYRPSQLRRDLARSEVLEILQQCGYNIEAVAEQQVVCLARRLQQCSAFPHEIGLFLGYPPEDVRGFMEQGSRACKCVGCWKVYGDVEAAQKRFDTYRACKDCYLRRLTRGNTIEQLAVAG